MGVLAPGQKGRRPLLGVALDITEEEESGAISSLLFLSLKFFSLSFSRVLGMNS